MAPSRMAALDFEASDKDPETARIVTCALILLGGGEPVETNRWLLNPGIKQEPGAIAVHGISDEYAAEHGMDAADGVRGIAESVAKVVAAGIPLAGHNLGGFDLNLLDREIRRHGQVGLEEFCGQPLTRVVDTMVIDRYTAPFRRRVSETQGPYQLRTTAETYELAWDEDEAHGADYDAMQSARVAWKMGDIAHRPAEQRPGWVQDLRDRGAKFEHLAVDLDTLFLRQQAWHIRWATDFEAYLRKSKPDAVVDAHWPLKPVAEGGAS